ncbi:beta-ketoacyl synthase N-terminal-like domain-containing protein [Pseudoalteromonas sp. Ld20]|uniref:beta-ketoacyl synthase N-terminal-like domain-containing protein n=1 Tax=Pseudoalteromonas sp. Ld20 TaxID=649165 RepID=UPI003868A032
MTLRDVYLNASDVLSASLGCEKSSQITTQEGTRVGFKSFRDEISCNDFFGILAHFDTLLLPLFKKLQLSADELAKTSLFLGSTSLDISAVELGAEDTLWLSKTDKISQELVKRYGLNELEFTFSTACTASANACLYATRLIAQGKIEHALVIGCEFYNPLTVEGFKSLDLISATGLAAFAKGRSGLILGEGLGALYLSSTPTEQCNLRVLGGASSCDTYSLTMTKEDGSHIAHVINECLTQTNITCDDIDLIKVHGTATLGNDEAECNALSSLFIRDSLTTDQISAKQLPPIIAFKPYTGHTLGACGAIEIALFVKCLELGSYTPPSYTHSENELMWPFYHGAHFNNVDTVLFNYFGFGGNNAALVLQRYKG